MRNGPFLAVLLAPFLFLSCGADNGYEAGKAYFNEARYEKAYEELIKGIDCKSPIEDYHLYYAGRAALALNDFSNARAHFAALVERHTNSLLYERSLHYRAYAAFAENGFNLEALVNDAMPLSRRSFIATETARYFFQQTNTNAMYEPLFQMTIRYGDGPSARMFDSAFRAVIETNAALSNAFIYALASALTKANMPDAAKPYWSRIAHAKEYATEAKYREGNYFAAKKNYARAEALLLPYTKQGSAYREDALYTLAELYRSYSAKSNHMARALRMYTTLATAYPKGAYANRALARITRIYVSWGDKTNARAYLAKTYARYPSSWTTETAARYYLRTMFQTSNKTETLYAMRLLERIYAKSDRGEYARSWKIYASEKFGAHADATNAAWETLRTTKDPFFLAEALRFATPALLDEIETADLARYSNALAALREGKTNEALKALNAMQHLSALTNAKESDALKNARALLNEIIDAHTFVSSYRAFKNPEAAYQAIIEREPYRGEKIAMLAYCRDYANGYNEAHALRKATLMDAALFIVTEHLLTNDGDYGTLMRSSMYIGDYFGYPYRANPILLPDDFRRYIYPNYYANIVHARAKEFGVDEAFVYSIIREESHFNNNATSWAGARGLMQLMDPTAREVNNNRKFNFSPLNAYDPEQNIALGTAHIAALAKSFNDNLPLMAASYNAGGGRGRTWRKEFSTNNMFYLTRMIPFEETEHYVNKVMRSYYYYRLFYPELDTANDERIIRVAPREEEIGNMGA